MMKTRLFCFLASLCLPFASAETPAELVQLKTSYEAAAQRALAPVKETYVAELDKLRVHYASTGNLGAALAAEAEMQAVQSRNASPESTGNGTVFEGIVTIPANSPAGFTLGPLQAGDTLTLSYMGGLWKNMGKLATENPDAVITEKGDSSRLVLAGPPVDGKEGPLLQMVPAQTAATPFSYTLPSAMDALVLRIRDNSTSASNPGFVTYKVTLVR